MRPTILLILTNAPGRSCFNPVERAMAYLNIPMSGLTIPIFTFGVHVVNGAVPIENEELEAKNINAGIEILADILKNITVNKHKLEISQVCAGKKECLLVYFMLF